MTTVEPQQEFVSRRLLLSMSTMYSNNREGCSYPCQQCTVITERVALIHVNNVQ